MTQSKRRDTIAKAPIADVAVAKQGWPLDTEFMCGRFTLRVSAKEIAEHFSVATNLELLPRYNVAPSQQIPAVRAAEGGRDLVMLQWGLIPSWSKEPKSGYSTINARAETVAEKPTFRTAFKKRRCLVVADGFYEWKKLDAKKKQPYFIHMQDDRPFAFAGLWEKWQRDDKAIESCSLIVTEPNELMAPIHDRMPVILKPADYDHPEFEGREELESLLRPYPSDEMEVYPVSTRVNNPRHDQQECVERMAD